LAARMIRELLMNGRELPESSTPMELPEQRALPAVAR